MEDWCTTFESMLFSGIELNREPLDISATLGGSLLFRSVEWLQNQGLVIYIYMLFFIPHRFHQHVLHRNFNRHCYYMIQIKGWLPGPEGTCDFQSVEPVKGWTRASVIALILIAASELDHVDPATEDKLKPLAKVLDKCWCIPCHAN